MSKELEHILYQLTLPDNEILQKATAQMKQAFRDPAVIPALGSVMMRSADPQVRQSAVVMLRMRVTKHWKKITPDYRESLKEMVLQALRHETEQKVQYSLSQLSAVMVKHEAIHRWPALLSLLTESISSNNPQDRQVGLLLLSKVLESNPEAFKLHYKQLLQMFGVALQDLSNTTALYYCILSLTAITIYISVDDMSLLCNIIPKLLTALKYLIQADQDKASNAMEVIDELLEIQFSVVIPQIILIMNFCLEVSADVSLIDSLRVKSLCCISLLIKLKTKAVVKQRLLTTILEVIFPILTATPPPGTEDPEDQETAEANSDPESPKHFAARVIDTMALYLPGERLFSLLTPLLEVSLASENIYERKGGLMCLAVMAEGCADYIRVEMVSPLLRTVCHNLSDSNHVVRGAALFALGQFCEYLQPEISKYHEVLMPLFLGYLSSLSEARIDHITKAFYAMENVLENLDEDDIQSYLPTLMENMLTVLNHTVHLKLKELVVSAIGAIANAAKEKLVPYFIPIMDSLTGFLTDTKDEMRSLQTQALDTLSVLTRIVGKDVFGPLYAECLQLGLNLGETVDDPDLRRCTYGLFAAVSAISPESVIPHLPAITTLIRLSLKSTEGLMHHIEEEKQLHPFDEDDDDDEGDIVLDESGENVVEEVFSYTVRNAYINEKEDACDALGDIAFYTSAAFSPFLESSFEQVFNLCTHPYPTVRKAAFGALGQFCRAQHKVWQENPTELNHHALHKLFSMAMPCFLEAIKHDRERIVVITVLDAMNSAIKSCKREALPTPERLAEVSLAIHDVLKRKIACQESGGNEEDDEGQQAEYDHMLLEIAGEGIPILASAVPAASLYSHLEYLLPLIISKANPSCTAAERSFSLGTLGELLHALAVVPGGGNVAGMLSRRLLPVLLGSVRDRDPEVRNNGVFSLGVLAQAAGPVIASAYPMILHLFSNQLDKEIDRKVIDNLCAAFCRMIMSYIEGVPLLQVLPAVLCRLPLRVDLEENKIVYSCLTFLYSYNPALIMRHLTLMLAAVAQVLGTDSLDTDTHNALVTMLGDLSKKYSQKFERALMSLPVELQSKIRMCIFEY